MPEGAIVKCTDGRTAIFDVGVNVTAVNNGAPCYDTCAYEARLCSCDRLGWCPLKAAQQSCCLAVPLGASS